MNPPEGAGGRLNALRDHYASEGRTPAFGLRSHLVVRDSEEDAWEAAHELVAHADPLVREQRRVAISGTAMVGQAAQAREAPDHRVGPHLWNGLSQVRVNCGTAIVGTPAQVAEELLAYWKLGFDEFILSGFPHVEECRRVAGEVLPLVRERISAMVAAQSGGAASV